MKEKYRKLSVLPALFIMIGIFCFSSQTASTSSDLSGGITEKLFNLVVGVGNIDINLPNKVLLLGSMETILRKAAHMTEYAILAVAISFPFYVYGRRKGRLVLWSELTCVFYAATDEFHQLLVPGRSGQIRDVFIDGCGAFIGCLIFIQLCSIINNKLKYKNFKSSKVQEEKNEKNKLGRVGNS